MSNSSEKRKRYYYKLYINIKNKKLWDVMESCNRNDIFPSDFICKAAIEKWESISKIQERHKPEPEQPPESIKPPFVSTKDIVIIDEAEETSKMIESGEYVIEGSPEWDELD